MCFINFYALSMAIGAFQVVFALGGISHLVNIFVAKLGWSESDTILYNTLINTASIFGLFLGNNFGGQLIRLGRRRAIFIANFVIVIACVI